MFEMPFSTITGPLFGTVGGVVSGSMGASIARYGLRAFAINLLFCGGFVGAAYGIIVATDLILPGLLQP